METDNVLSSSGGIESAVQAHSIRLGARRFRTPYAVVQVAVSATETGLGISHAGGPTYIIP